MDRPAWKTVLLQQLLIVVVAGLVFFTNRDSQKGRELAENPWASVCFPWNVLARQVRVAGPVELVDDAVERGPGRLGRRRLACRRAGGRTRNE